MRTTSETRAHELHATVLDLVNDIDRSSSASRAWVHEAIRRLEADANRSADTHLFPLPLANLAGIDIYLKDESSHPTGSLKHRLARSLFLYALCNGWLAEGTPVVEASSGSTAVSEAYFANLLGLPFTAVVPRSTSPSKIALIERQGGFCRFVEDPTQVYGEAERYADEVGGCYLDQFTHADRATDWRGNNNIAESIFDQMCDERFPIPAWIVVGAGTGGTSATIGRYVRFRRHDTSLAVVDPEGSAFFPSWRDHDRQHVTGVGSRIEGIGRPRVEPSFVTGAIDRMIAVPDRTSVEVMGVVSRMLNRPVGPSTGTSVAGALHIARLMHAAGEQGSIVTLLCDGGERYTDTYHSDSWLRRQGISPRVDRTNAEDDQKRVTGV